MEAFAIMGRGLFFAAGLRVFGRGARRTKGPRGVVQAGVGKFSIDLNVGFVDECHGFFYHNLFACFVSFPCVRFLFGHRIRQAHVFFFFFF